MMSTAVVVVDRQPDRRRVVHVRRFSALDRLRGMWAYERHANASGTRGRRTCRIVTFARFTAARTQPRARCLSCAEPQLCCQRNVTFWGEEECCDPRTPFSLAGARRGAAFAWRDLPFVPPMASPSRPSCWTSRHLRRQAEGACSICGSIGGQPAPHIPWAILATLERLGARRTLPVVLNSNFYLTATALDLLADAIDIYLPDLKFLPQPARKVAVKQSAACRITGLSSPAASNVWQRRGGG